MYSSNKGASLLISAPSSTTLVASVQTLCHQTHWQLSRTHTFLQSLQKFFTKISLEVYSWSSILAKNPATYKAEWSPL